MGVSVEVGEIPRCDKCATCFVYKLLLQVDITLHFL